MGRLGGLKTISGLPNLGNKRRRKIFTASMSILSALYGGLIAYRMFNAQDDFIFDILKVFIAVGFTTSVFAYLFWSLFMRRKESYVRAALAGVFTAICVLPVPAFIWAVKSEIRSIFNADINLIFSGLSSIMSLSAENFLWSFSLAEAVTLPLSAMVGMIVVRKA